jgi:hypothetical protein
MPVEQITGIEFPSAVESAEYSSKVQVLQAIASCNITHLVNGGYLAKSAKDSYQQDYLQSLRPGTISTDFVAFLAARKAHETSQSIEAEISVIQNILHEHIGSSVFYWDFGRMRAGVSPLFATHPALKSICELLECFITLASDLSILQVASINPISALVASSWIKHQLLSDATNEMPFIFSFMVDYPTWNIFPIHTFKS